MSQSAKPEKSQEGWQPPIRRGWARPAGRGLLAEAAPALARAGFADPSLVLRWSEIAGSEIARIARPTKWQEGPDGAVLTLKCEAGAAVLLQHQTRMLIERLNAYLGAGRVARIKFVPGPMMPVTEPSRHPAPDAKPTGEHLDLPAALTRLGGLRARLGPPARKRPD